jgi:uncharacterized protein
MNNGIPPETIAAAQTGHPRAQHNVGCYYYYGKGVPKDLVKAVQWWSKAAEQGDPEAQYSLGFFCYEQIGAKESFKWMQKAADNGHQYAQAFLGSMYFWGGPIVSRNKVTALKWLILATKNNSRIPPRIFCRVMKTLMTAQQIAEAERLANSWEPLPDVLSETNPP